MLDPRAKVVKRLKVRWLLYFLFELDANIDIRGRFSRCRRMIHRSIDLLWKLHMTLRWEE
jgi:hypothetical protein